MLRNVCITRWSGGLWLHVVRVADTVDAGICAAGTIQRCYVLTATPVNGGLQSKDSRCTTFILDSTGAKTATGTDSNACW